MSTAYSTDSPSTSTMTLAGGTSALGPRALNCNTLTPKLYGRETGIWASLLPGAGA